MAQEFNAIFPAAFLEVPEATKAAKSAAQAMQVAQQQQPAGPQIQPAASGTTGSSGGSTDWSKLFCGRAHCLSAGPLTFGRSHHFSLTRGPAGTQSTTGSLSAPSRTKLYRLSHEAGFYGLVKTGEQTALSGWQNGGRRDSMFLQQSGKFLLSIKKQHSI